MKKSVLSFFSSILIVLAAVPNCIAQEMEFNVLSPPCFGNDGVMEIIVPGIWPDMAYQVYFTGNGLPHYGPYTFYGPYDIIYNLGPFEGTNVEVGTYGFIPTGVPTAGGVDVVNGLTYPFLLDPPIIIQPICPETEGTVEFNINNGEQPSLVSWHEASGNTPGAFITNDNPATLTAGEHYIALIEDGSGCYIQQNVSFSQISELNVYTSSTQASCDNGTATLDSVTGGPAPYTYQWSNGANTPSIENLIEGTYTLQVTDANGCTGSRNTGVWQGLNGFQIEFTSTSADCLEDNGSLMAFPTSGVAPYSYQWSNGATTQLNEGLSGGQNYTVHVTDANGCMEIAERDVNITTPITTTFSMVPSSCSEPTGSITLEIDGGTPPYSVTWGTFPLQTGTTANGLGPGNYQFSIMDDAGCEYSGSVFVQPESVLNGWLSASPAICPSNEGSIEANTTGTNPPFTYSWNTGSTDSVISPAPIGSYSCVITDNVGCSITKSGTVYQSSPVHVSLATTPTSCVYNCDGEVFANAFGGTPPYAYQYSNGQTTQTAQVCASGGSITVTDANGCAVSDYFSVGNSNSIDDCYCTIEGVVYEDENGNCIQDPGEAGLENIQIHCEGFGYTFTNSSGAYSFQVTPGSYAITQISEFPYILSACQANSIPVVVDSTFSGCEFEVNFGNQVEPVRDLHLWTTRHGNPPVPGNEYTVRRVVENVGTVDETDIVASFRHTGLIGTPTFAPYAVTQDPTFTSLYNIESGILELEPGENASQDATYDMPTNIPNGDQLFFYDTFAFDGSSANWLADETPWNNVSMYEDVVVSSYDPNMVEVSPQGYTQQGYILITDSVLDYIIHFQNTGNWYAQNIVIKMALDEDVQIESFVPGYSEDEYSVSISEDREVTWTFEDINLPWQDLGEYLSRGLVGFSVKQNPNLPFGTQIEATAAIYFDYNPPVITNTALNTIDDPFGVEEQMNANQLLVFPNPSNGIFNAKLPAEAGRVVNATVYDMTGRAVLSTSNVSQVDLSSADNGHYVLVVNTATGIYRQKLVVRK